MSTRIKIVGLSPKTTQLLRARTTLQQKQGIIAIGRTVLQFELDSGDTLQLIDHLIGAEIPASGASSKEVKRLRDLRDRVRYPAMEGSGVTIFEKADAEREKLLDLLAELYAGACEKDWGEVDDLAELMHDGGPWDDRPTRDEFRIWLSEKL